MQAGDDPHDSMHANRLALLGRCVAMIVHDAAQPVASVATRGQSALRWLRHDPPDIDAALASLERLVADAERAGALLAELRALASPVARPRQPVPLGALLREMLHWLDDELRTHGIDVTTDLRDDGGAVMAERAALQQLFVNLVVNAIEAMADTPPDARRLTVALSAQADTYVVAVSDRGCGIAADAAPLLFDAFYTTKETGMGMGLAICHRIATEHGGGIHAERCPEGGARLVVRLPRIAQAAA